MVFCQIHKEYHYIGSRQCSSNNFYNYRLDFLNGRLTLFNDMKTSLVLRGISIILLHKTEKGFLHMGCSILSFRNVYCNHIFVIERVIIIIPSPYVWLFFTEKYSTFSLLIIPGHY